MSEPTSALTFRDLILEVARFLGTASYGTDGDGPADIPSDAHDLDEAKRHVNAGIRMFLNDSPPAGWRFSQPIASITAWADISTGSGKTVSGGAYSSSTNRTILTASEDTFFDSMEEKDIVITSVGTFTIKTYLSATQVKVEGDASGASASTFSLDSNGAFTLPKSFGGLYSGAITLAAGTNQGAPVEWTDEANMRQIRENVTTETGDPTLAAIRVLSGGRRWELVVYPTPDEQTTLEFKYDLYFDSLIALDDRPPIPFTHDETLRAAALAVAERDNDDEAGVRMQEYLTRMLPQSHQRDERSAPRRLGIMGSADVMPITPRNFRNFQDRPTVEVN